LIVLVGKFVHEVTRSSTNITGQKGTLLSDEYMTLLEEIDLRRTQKSYVEPDEVPSNSMVGSKSSIREMSTSKHG
jgi:hypothetical protein